MKETEGRGDGVAEDIAGQEQRGSKQFRLTRQILKIHHELADI